MRTPGFGVSRESSTSGVFPTSSRRLPATGLATGHRRQQDHRVALRDCGVEAVARADILAADVDVRVLELALQPREATHQVVEEVANRLPVGQHLALAAGLGTEHRWDPNDAHACNRRV